MARLLFPRLSDAVAGGIWDELSGLSVSELRRRVSAEHKLAVYAQTGGHRTDRSQISGIRDGIVEIASNQGFPDKNDREKRARFDAETAAWLLEKARLPVGEAMRKEVWSFLSLVVMPDICRWRFPSSGKERFFGGIRNTLQRLWIRAFLLGGDKHDLDRWKLLSVLTEDAFVALVERPGVSSNPCIARQIAFGWSRTAASIGRGKMEAVHRDTMKRIRELSPVICLDVLPESDLAAVIDSMYNESVQTISSKPCSECEGSGLIGDKVCPLCDGTGKAGIQYDDGSVQCQHCSGSGLYRGQQCEKCGGYGVLEMV